MFGPQLRETEHAIDMSDLYFVTLCPVVWKLFIQSNPFETSIAQVSIFNICWIHHLQGTRYYSSYALTVLARCVGMEVAYSVRCRDLFSNFHFPFSFHFSKKDCSVEKILRLKTRSQPLKAIESLTFRKKGHRVRSYIDGWNRTLDPSQM